MTTYWYKWQNVVPPLPGEPIVGFITRGRGVTIHRANCPRALDMDPARKIQVEWSNAGLSRCLS